MKLERTGSRALESKRDSSSLVNVAFMRLVAFYKRRNS